MIKRKERAALNDLDVGPFSDISFLLIIFFILTTQIISMSGIVLSIPAGAPKEEMQEMEEDKQIMVTLTNEVILLRLPSGEERSIMAASVAELKAYLLAQDLNRKENVSEKLIVLESRPDVKFDLYYKVITIIESAGGLLALVEEDSAGEGGN